DGYKIKVNKLESCDNKGTLKLTNPKVELTKDCHVVISGCAELTAGFSSCKVLYDVKKKGMMVPFKGERDACEELAKLSKKQDVADKLKQYKISKNCPINAVKACASKGEKVDISSYKDKFRLAAGQYSGTITIQANSGSSCFKFDAEFKRGK
ncbi:hypothetical protein Cfor_06931, partial [Coptotermes formosanus]